MPNWAEYPLKYGTAVIDIAFLLSAAILIPVNFASLLYKATSF